MTKPIAILSNPRAGTGRSVTMVQKITALLGEKKIAHVVFHEGWPTDYQAYGAVWIVGGDGTLNYFINHYRIGKTPIAIFKAGTGNDFATNIYGKATLHEMVDIVLRASPKAIDAGMCNGKYFLNTVGIGFDGKVLKHMGSIRWMGGFLGYYVAIIKNIFTFKELEFTVKADQQAPVHGRLLLILVSNSPSTGGGFRVSPLARPNDGVLDLITCLPLTVSKRLIALPAIRKGQHLRFPFIQHKTMQSLQIDCAGTAPAQVDGELMVASSFSCSVLPGHFNFLF